MKLNIFSGRQPTAGEVREKQNDLVSRRAELQTQLSQAEAAVAAAYGDAKTDMGPLYQQVIRLEQELKALTAVSQALEDEQRNVFIRDQVEAYRNDCKQISQDTERALELQPEIEHLIAQLNAKVLEANACRARVLQRKSGLGATIVRAIERAGYDQRELLPILRQQFDQVRADYPLLNTNLGQSVANVMNQIKG